MPIDFAETAANFLEFPTYYYYHFVSDNGMEVYVLRDEAAPKITGGLGGWEIVDRRRRKGLTNWTGRDPWSMTIPILFDGMSDPLNSVDKDIAILNRMAFGDNFVIPPTVKVEGVLPITGIRWVIRNITFGDNAIWERGEAGEIIRVRQDAVVDVLQYVEEDIVKTNPNTTKSYTTKSGDTPKVIAQRELGNAALWTKIRDLNPTLVRDPNQKLPTGTTLQIPMVPTNK